MVQFRNRGWFSRQPKVEINPSVNTNTATQQNVLDNLRGDNASTATQQAVENTFARDNAALEEARAVQRGVDQQVANLEKQNEVNNSPGAETKRPEDYTRKPFGEAAPQPGTRKLDAFNAMLQSPEDYQKEQERRAQAARRSQLFKKAGQALTAFFNLGNTIKGSPSQTIPDTKTASPYADIENRIEAYRQKYVKGQQDAINADYKNYMDAKKEWDRRYDAHEKREDDNERAARRAQERWDDRTRQIEAAERKQKADQDFKADQNEKRLQNQRVVAGIRKSTRTGGSGRHYSVYDVYDNNGELVASYDGERWGNAEAEKKANAHNQKLHPDDSPAYRESVQEQSRKRNLHAKTGTTKKKHNLDFK